MLLSNTQSPSLHAFYDVCIGLHRACALSWRIPADRLKARTLGCRPIQALSQGQEEGGQWSGS